MIYEQLSGQVVYPWKGRVSRSMKSYLGSKYSQYADTDTVEVLTRAYHELIQQGDAIRFEWSKRPAKGAYGTPTLEGARTILKIQKRTDIPLPAVVAYANAMTYNYDRGDIDQRDYDPATYDQTLAAVKAIPAQQEKIEEREAYVKLINDITGGAESIGKGITGIVKTIPWILGAYVAIQLVPRLMKRK